MQCGEQKTTSVSTCFETRSKEESLFRRLVPARFKERHGLRQVPGQGFPQRTNIEKKSYLEDMNFILFQLPTV